MAGYNPSKAKISAPDLLLEQIEEICNLLKKTADEDLNSNIQIDTQEVSIQKLCMLINHFIKKTHRSIDSIQNRNIRLTQLGKLKSEFMANISHEIRTPLTMILGPLETLLDDKSTFTSEQVANLELVKRNAYRLYVLVNDLLDFSKLDAGKFVIHNEVIDINANIAKLINDAQRLAKEKEITLKFVKCDSIKCILIDNTMLEKIILNLLSNALKFTAVGGKVVVEVKNTEKCFQIIVSDTGVGIPPSQIETLFGNFYSKEALQSSRYEGSGIGLTIVKQFCELMGGSIYVESQDNKGSKFIITFTLNPFSEMDMISENSNLGMIEKDLPVTSSHAMLSSLSADTVTDEVKKLEGKLPLILIVDDDQDLRSFIRAILINSYEIITAKNGQEALEAIYQYHPQIVLSDVMMPIMNGYELIQAIKSDTNIQHTPVILITAKNENESVASCLDAGADDYLAKPFSSDELLSRIEASLRVYNTLHALSKTQNELKNALYEAEKSTKAKSMFLANMSHEIRTPMNGVLGMLQLLEHTSLDEKQYHYVNKGIEAANSLLKILGDILDFSKIESGLISIEKINFNLKFEIETLMDIFLTLCTQKEVQFELIYNDKIPSQLLGDPTRIKQIIVNLVNNAIKFTPNGGKIELNIDLLPSLPQQQTAEFTVVQIAVKDTGIGIAPEAQLKIFDKFTQADESTTRKFGGTGLGLAIAKELVELMGGAIRVDSTIGIGTTFIATLKLKTATQNPTHPEQKDNSSKINSTKAHILLAEDNELNQMVACEMLSILGCCIDVVDSGEDALKSAFTKKYDLIFMDCQMPGMDGLTATQKIRDHEKQLQLQDDKKNIIVALTANTLKETRERCMDVGMNDYLTKPYHIDDLSKILKKYVPDNHSLTKSKDT